MSAPSCTLNWVPNQKVTTVSLFSWHHTYTADMIRGSISSQRSSNRLSILVRSRTSTAHTSQCNTAKGSQISICTCVCIPISSPEVCHKGTCVVVTQVIWNKYTLSVSLCTPLQQGFNLFSCSYTVHNGLEYSILQYSMSTSVLCTVSTHLLTLLHG